MKALISGWRTALKNDRLPFYFVQLANLNTSDPDNPAGGDLPGSAAAKKRSLRLCIQPRGLQSLRPSHKPLP